MKKIIVANWKLNPNKASEAKKLASSYKKSAKYDFIISPPPIFMPLLSKKKLCAQSVFEEKSGPYLGQMSVLQLKDMKVKYALVGHSASRKFHVNPERIGKRLSLCVTAGITPIYCVGSTLLSKDSLKNALAKIDKQIVEECETAYLNKMILAIEPDYAISSGVGDKSHHPADLEFMNDILKAVKDNYNFKAVIYGGSIDEVVGKSYLKAFDGLLLGKLSLDSKKTNKLLA